jgi:hypothetical protein
MKIGKHIGVQVCVITLTQTLMKYSTTWFFSKVLDLQRLIFIVLLSNISGVQFNSDKETTQAAVHDRYRNTPKE